MENRENQRVTITKRMLLEALFELLEKKHINQISVTELCSRAGINRATFYKHYSTPNDILTEVAQQQASFVLQIQEGDRKNRSMLQIIEDCCAFLYEQKKLFKILIRNGMDEEHSAQALILLLKKTALLNVNLFENLDNTDRLLLITYIASGCYHLIKKWLMEDLPKTSQEIAGLIYRICTTGWIDA